METSVFPHFILLFPLVKYVCHLSLLSFCHVFQVIDKCPIEKTIVLIPNQTDFPLIAENKKTKQGITANGIGINKNVLNKYW